MLNLDTHIVVALLKGELTAEERDAVLRHPLAISHIVIWELAKLRQLGRLKIDLQSEEFKDFLKAVVVFPTSVAIAVQSTGLDFTSDPADEIIAATSVVEGIPLLTRDQRILSSVMVSFVR
jgi:PIN domain nuclease of toxin-antitoxin system